jgi:tRNA 2-selenouridine synthase
LINEFERICSHYPLLLLGGRTGCNKTALIEESARAADLEGLANHLGSSFGRRADGQPSQLNFENALAISMLKAERQAAQTGQPMLFEDEGRLLGRCVLPPALMAAMKRSSIVVLEASLEERVEHSHRNYILNKLAEWQRQLGEAYAFDTFAEDLTQALFRVRKRLGGVAYGEISNLLEQALNAHRKGDPEQHRGWIERLLVDYYDPMYDYQLRSRSDLIVFRGDRAAVRDWLNI